MIGTIVTGASVIVCCGSGGVGKTTTAAVLGLEGARAGRRTVVVTIDPAKRLADALGLPGGLSGDPQRIDLSAEPSATGELWAMMLDTAATFDGLVSRYAEDDEQVERILSNPFYRNMAGAMSGTQEYMAAEKLHELHADERFDLVVVDTPPSRSALDFLEAPGVLARFLDHRVFRLLMLPTRSGLRIIGTAAQPILKAIGRVVGSDVLADTVAFFQAFSGMESGFRERAGEVVALLRAPETAFVIVASPRHDTVEEAVWFGEQLVKQDVEVAAAIVNRTHPEFGRGTSADAYQRAASYRPAGGADVADGDRAEKLSRLWVNVAELRTMRERELGVVAPLLSIVGADRTSMLPLLDRDVHDLESLEVIGDHLFAGSSVREPPPGSV